MCGLCCRPPSALPAVQEQSPVRQPMEQAVHQGSHMHARLTTTSTSSTGLGPEEGCCTSSRAEWTLQDSVCSLASWGTATARSFASHSKCSARDFSSGRLHTPFKKTAQNR